MKRPRFRRAIPGGLCGRQAAVERHRPCAPSPANHQGSFEQPAKAQDFSPAPGLGGVLLHAQECFGFFQQDDRAPAVSFRPRGEKRDGAIHPGRKVFPAAEPVHDAIRDQNA
jgi:hypothetical protein